MFQLPEVDHVYMYPKPIPMNWSEKKLTEIAKDEMDVDPEDGAVLLFFNKKKDQLKLAFRDPNGWQEFQKWMPKGGFMVPAPEEGQRFVKLGKDKLNSLFRTV